MKGAYQVKIIVIGVIALTIGLLFAVLSTLLFFPILTGMSY